MHVTLLESDRNWFRSAELITLSIALHVAAVGLIAVSAAGTFRLPADERDARVLFLLPPDPAGEDREAEVFLPGKPGSGLDEASMLPAEGQGLRLESNTRRSSPREGERAGAPSEEAFGPAPFLQEMVYSALQVDQMVERYASSAAPVYPPELSARGTEGKVEAEYVVDSDGRVDTTTIRVMQSDHPRFTESVRTALGEARFRPAKRGGKAVRQLVQQRFRFKLAQPGVIQAN